MLKASIKEIYYIYEISNPMHNKEGVLKGVEDIMSTILADSKPPFRIVSRLIPEIITEEQIAANIKIESTYHSTFHEFPVSYSVLIQLTKLNLADADNG
jgi:hypothetical protein